MAVSPDEKHDHEPLNFPEGFLWGTATSAYQVEGGNIYSDWEDFQSSGKAADQYNLYITNNKTKPITFKFEYRDDKISVSILE